jgi:hypothetical protein
VTERSLRVPSLERTLRGAVAVAGIGETAYYKHGQLARGRVQAGLQAILAACADAGIDPHDIDGFAVLQQRPLRPVAPGRGAGLPRCARTTMQWGGGGGRLRRGGGQRGGGHCRRAGRLRGGVPRAGAGPARPLRPGQAGRHGRARWPTMAPYGVLSPAQKYAMKVQRFMHEHGVRQEALRAVALASYHHAQANPRAVMHGKPLDAARYDASRWIVEPFHLYDCCMENDGAAARCWSRRTRARPEAASRPTCWAWPWAATTARSPARTTQPHYASASFVGVAQDLYRMAGVGPADVGSGAGLRELHRRRGDGAGRARLLRARRGQRLHARPTPHRARRPPAAEHQRRQPGRVLHARLRAGARGGAPGARPVHQRRPRGTTWRW